MLEGSGPDVVRNMGATAGELTDGRNEIVPVKRERGQLEGGKYVQKGSPE